MNPPDAVVPAPNHSSSPAPGLWRWITTTNHKDIGTLYILFAFTMFLIGGIFALFVRWQLFSPDVQIMDANLYNQAITMHGLVMIFGFLMPVGVGFANWNIPLMIGAADMALPRLNNLSFWVLVIAFIVLLSSLVLSQPGPNAGWTFYAPLSASYGPPSIDYMIFAIHLMGLSSIMGAINIIVTILNMRCPNMRLRDMPMFCWAWLVTSFLLLAAMPILAGTVTMLLFDRHFGTTFFNAAGGGDPLLFQHLFWFFGHPEVYILILPAFGVISQVIPIFARKPLFGYYTMVAALIGIGLLSFFVWAHHMFAAGIATGSQLYFMFITLLVAVPTGVKIFNWLATLYKGSISFEPPMLFAIAFLLQFTIGGLTGVMLALAPVNFQYHDSYFVVGHFHYVIVSGAVFAVFAGIYLWLPKWTGHMYSYRLANWHFWLSVISVNMTFFPMHFLGLAGMPRRIVDYSLQFTNFNMVSSIGALIFGVSQLLFIYIALRSFNHGKPASNHVWQGSKGLEWILSSPPPYHSFHTPPVFTHHEHTSHHHEEKLS